MCTLMIAHAFTQYLLQYFNVNAHNSPVYSVSNKMHVQFMITSIQRKQHDSSCRQWNYRSTSFDCAFNSSWQKAVYKHCHIVREWFWFNGPKKEYKTAPCHLDTAIRKHVKCNNSNSALSKGMAKIVEKDWAAIFYAMINKLDLYSESFVCYVLSGSWDNRNDFCYPLCLSVCVCVWVLVFVW